MGIPVFLQQGYFMLQVKCCNFVVGGYATSKSQKAPLHHPHVITGTLCPEPFLQLSTHNCPWKILIIRILWISLRHSESILAAVVV